MDFETYARVIKQSAPYRAELRDGTIQLRWQFGSKATAEDWLREAENYGVQNLVLRNPTQLEALASCSVPRPTREWWILYEDPDPDFTSHQRNLLLD